MEKFILTKRNISIALGTSVLAFTGCSGQEYTATDVTTTTYEAPTLESSSEASELNGDAMYYSDGVREIKLYDKSNTTILQFCDNLDLVELYNGTLERSVQHPACIDHKLTPEDFQFTPQETK